MKKCLHFCAITALALSEPGNPSVLDESLCSSTAVNDELEKVFNFPGLPFPFPNPAGLETEPDPIEFDPEKHLQFEPPPSLKTLFVDDPVRESVPFPVPDDRKFSNFGGLAFSQPFRVLSDEGVAALREIMFRHEHRAYSNERIPKCIRGLGYWSQFIRNFTYHPPILDYLTAMAQQQIWPHDVQMNIAHTNWGKVGGEQRVDQWHLDSVDYVMVLILSDSTDMEGGELQVARIANTTEALMLVKSGKMPKEKVDTVTYPGPGWAVFMQGSKIAHAVTRVKRAREQRISLVNSFQTRNVFAQDRTLYRTFKVQDPSHVAPIELMRHVAWRAQGQLESVINPLSSPCVSTDSPEACRNKQGLQWGAEGVRSYAQVLKNAAKELVRAAALATDELQDESPYLTE